MENRNIKIAYLCSYTPSYFLDNLGFELIPLYMHEGFPGTQSKDFPINICSYVRHCKKVLSNLEVDGVIFTNCCNAMQRLYDAIKVEKPEWFSFMLELYRNHSKEDDEFFKKNTFKLIDDLCDYFDVEIPTKKALFDITDNNNDGDFNVEKESIYVLGSAISPKMSEFLIENLKPYSVLFNLCSDRENQFIQNTFFQSVPCPRSELFVNWFFQYIEKNRKNIKGVIHLGSQHCDQFLFDFPMVQKACDKFGVPIQNIEISYSSRGFGQMSTRLEAFVESIQINTMLDVKTEVSDEVVHKKPSPLFKKMMRLVTGVIPQQPLEAIKKIIQYQSDVFSVHAWENPEKIIWTNMVMPSELFYAADLIPVNMELVAGWLASLGLSERYISAAEAMGFSPNICSYHKATLGLIKEGGFPVPQISAISSHICDGGVGVVNYFTDTYDTKSYVLNVPYNYSDDSLEYVCQQYKHLKSWIESYTGKKIDKDRLREAVELSNKARTYWEKTFEIRKGEPLFQGHLSLRNLFGTTFLFGSQIGVDVSKSYYEQLANAPQVSTSNKKRILWIHFAPLYHNKIMEYLERDLNCWIVMDITGYISWPEYDVEHPISSMAKRSLSHFYLGDVFKRNELYHRLIEEYKIDGVVHFMHNGCRAIPGSSQQIRDVADKLNTPYLELPGDCIDPRGYSEAQMQIRLEAFVETLVGGEYVSWN